MATCQGERRCSTAAAGPPVAALIAVGPEQSIGNAVSHPEAPAGGERVPGEILALLHRIQQPQAVGEISADTGRECGATTMAQNVQTLPAVFPHESLFVVQPVFVV